jgi:hypothetical protein
MPPKALCAKHAVPLMLRRNAKTGEVALACHIVTWKNVEAVKTRGALSTMPCARNRNDRTSERAHY